MGDRWSQSVVRAEDGCAWRAEGALALLVLI